MSTPILWALRLTPENELESYSLSEEETAALRVEAAPYSVYRFRNIPGVLPLDPIKAHTPGEEQVFVTKDGRLYGFYVTMTGRGTVIEGLLDLEGHYGEIKESISLLSAGAPDMFAFLEKDGRRISPVLGERSIFRHTLSHVSCSRLIYHRNGSTNFLSGQEGRERLAGLLRQSALYGFRVIDRGMRWDGRYKRVSFIWFGTRDDCLAEEDGNFIGFRLEGNVYSLSSDASQYVNILALLPSWPGLRLSYEGEYGGGGVEIRMVKFDRPYSLPVTGAEAEALEGHYELIG